MVVKYFNMRTVQIEVKEDTAQRIEQLTKSEKNELSRFIDVWLQDRRSLREVMDDISEYAQRQGLTPELLDKLLKEND